MVRPTVLYGQNFNHSTNHTLFLKVFDTILNEVRNEYIRRSLEIHDIGQKIEEERLL